MYTLLLVLISVSKLTCAPVLIQEQFPAHTDVNRFPYIDGPEILADARPHHMFIGKCTTSDYLLHSETIIINNDGTSRTAGDIKVNVEGPVVITCVKMLNQVDENGLSGAYPSYLDGGVGHNYVILGFKTAYGYGANFYIEIRGIDKK